MIRSDQALDHNDGVFSDGFCRIYALKFFFDRITKILVLTFDQGKIEFRFCRIDVRVRVTFSLPIVMRLDAPYIIFLNFWMRIIP